MSKAKLAGVGFVVLVGIAATIAVLILVSGNKVKSDVNSLKGWKLPEGVAVERVAKSKKLGKVKEVVDHGDSAVPHLVAAVKSWPPSDSLGAMVALGLLKAKDGIEPIAGVLLKEEGDFGEAAAAVLAMYGSSAAAKIKELSQGVDKLPPPVRANVYRALAWSREDSLLEPLARGMADSDRSVALVTADLVSGRRNKALVAPLVAALSSPDQDLSAKAVAGLIHNKEGLDPDAIEKLLQSGSPHVVAGALLVLGRLDKSTLSLTIAKYLDDPREQVASAAAEAMLDAGGKLDSSKILRLLESADAAVVARTVNVLKRAKASDGKEKYVELLTHANKHSRKAGAELLALCAKPQPEGLLDDPAVPGLIELLKDADLSSTACETLKLLTRNDNMAASYRDWTSWWDRYKALETLLKEARDNYTKVKAWVDSGEIRDHVREGVKLLERSLQLFDEIGEKNLTRNNYDNECQKIQILLRQASTLLSSEDDEDGGGEDGGGEDGGEGD